MNPKLKTALAAMGVLGAIGFGAGAVLADGGDSGRGCGGFHRMRGPFGGDMKAKADARLNRLHDELNLRADQEPAWGEFRAAVSEQAGHMQQKVKGLRDAAPARTASERLERAQMGLDEARGALDKVAVATKRFYAALDAGQQARFDQLALRFGPGGGRGWGSEAPSYPPATGRGEL